MVLRILLAVQNKHSLFCQRSTKYKYYHYSRQYAETINYINKMLFKPKIVIA